MPGNERSMWQNLGQFLLIYGAWFAAIALLTLGFLLLRTGVNQWYVALEMPPRGRTITDRSLIYVGGAIWMFFIFYLEGYLRDGQKRDDLRERMRRVFVRTGIFAGIGLALVAGVTLYVQLAG